MKNQDDVRVTVRVDRDLKEQAEILFEQLGLNMSSALNVFLRKAVDESAIPFYISTKTPFIGDGYSPADITNAFKASVSSEIKNSKNIGSPVARYDSSIKQAYLEFSDGTREYING